MSNESDQRKVAHELTKHLADTNNIIGGGWNAFVIVCKLQDAPPIQLSEMRKAFFAGAQHLFGSMMNVLEAGQEPTQKDMDRITGIHEELEEFTKEFAATMGRN